MAQRGFTLIELLVVVAIIGILAAAAIPQITGAICDARGAAAEQGISAARTAYAQCLVDNNASTCIGSMGGTYNAYLSNSTMNHISIHNDGSVMNAIVYNGIGCDYNAPDGNQSASGKIKWVQETGNIIND